MEGNAETDHECCVGYGRKRGGAQRGGGMDGAGEVEFGYEGVV